MNLNLRLLVLLLLLLVSGATYFYRVHVTDLIRPESRQPTEAGQHNPAKRGLARLDEDTKTQIQTYFQGLELPPEENNLRFAMELDGKYGRTALHNGDDQTAYEIYRKVLAISYQQQDLQGIGLSLGVLGQIYKRKGDKDTAFDLLSLQYATALANGRRFETGIVEQQLSSLLDDMDPAKATNFRLKALKSLQGTPYKQDYISILVELSTVANNLLSPELSLRLAKHAWDTALSAGNSADIANMRAPAAGHYAEKLQKQGDYPAAVAVLEQALKLYPATNRDVMRYSKLLFDLADAHALLGHWQQALPHYMEAYRLYEAARPKASDDAARVQMEAENADPIRHYVAALLALNNSAEALALLETNKAHSLRAATAQHRNSADAFDAQQLDGLQKALGAGQAAIALLASDKQLGVFLLTANNLQYFPSALGHDQYIHQLQRLRVALRNPYADFYREAAQNLGNALLKPALAALPPKVTQIIYSSDGGFGYVPLGVLMPDGQFLNQRYRLLRVASLAALDAQGLNALHADTGIACVDPEVSGQRLPFQQILAEKLAKRYGSHLQSLSGSACNIAGLQRSLESAVPASFLHLGGVTYTHPKDTLQGGVLLAAPNQPRGAIWRETSIANSDMRRVTLVSVSNAVVSRKLDADTRDLVGLPRALLSAGARQVLAPLWPTHDETSQQLLSVFYERYANGDSAAQALQAAQRSLSTGGRFAHPYYWAGFELTGDAL